MDNRYYGVYDVKKRENGFIYIDGERGIFTYPRSFGEENSIKDYREEDYNYVNGDYEVFVYFNSYKGEENRVSIHKISTDEWRQYILADRTCWSPFSYEYEIGLLFNKCEHNTIITKRNAGECVYNI